MTDGRTTRARAKREERRAQILDAALRVFADQGYHTTSVSDLVAAAGVARGTFYLYFEGKQQIFLELVDSLMLAFRGSVRGVDVGPDAPPLEAQVVSTLVRMLTAVQQRRALATILFREAVGLGDEVDDRLARFEGALHAWLVASLDNGVRLGLLRPHDSDVVATLVYGSLRQVIDHYVVRGADDLDVQRVAEEVVALHLRGLTPDA